MFSERKLNDKMADTWKPKYSAWTKYEDQTLLDEILRNVPVQKIAETHQRTVKTIATRIKHHAIYRMIFMELPPEVVSFQMNIPLDQLRKYRTSYESKHFIIPKTIASFYGKSRPIMTHEEYISNISQSCIRLNAKLENNQLTLTDPNYSIIKGDKIPNEFNCHILQYNGWIDRNPGEIVISASLFAPRGKRIIFEKGDYIAYGSMHYASYMALLMGIESCAGIGVKALIIEGTSKFVFQQLTGLIKVRSDQFKAITDKINRLINEYFDFTAIRLIPNYKSEKDIRSLVLKSKQPICIWK